jgi:hypothetical protein
MAKDKRPIRSVQIRANFRSNVRIFAGDSEPDAAAMHYVTDGNPSPKLVDEVFAKTINAIHKREPSILLVIRDDKFIEEDEETGVAIAAALTPAMARALEPPDNEPGRARPKPSPKAEAASKPAGKSAKAAPKRAGASGPSPKKPRKKDD